MDLPKEVSELDDGEDEIFNGIDIENLMLAKSDLPLNSARVTSVDPKKPVVRKTPLQQLRPRSVFVTDFVTHNWCPQQGYLSASHPHFAEDMEDIITAANPTIQPVLKIGSAIHEKRENEVHVTKVIKTSSPEDRFAVRLLNTHVLLRALLQGKPLEREIPIFGMPFDLGVVVFGIIDEVRLDLRTGFLTLGEFKTRKSDQPPKSAQAAGNDLQIMLYKRLLEDFIQKKTPWNLVLNILRLDGNFQLSENVRKEIKKYFLTEKNLENLNDLYRKTMEMTAVFPKNFHLTIEYLHQKTGKTFLVKDVFYDDVWLRGKMEDFMNVWTGRKPMLGAPVEEGWKCRMCYFAGMCEWRLARI